MLNDLEDCRFILLEGRPGSGKTTLMNKISHDWANRDILASKLVVYIPLRRLNPESDRKLTTILRVACPTLPKDDIKHLASGIEKKQGEGVVFAFDGLDEYVPYYYCKKKRWFKFRHEDDTKIDDVFQKLYGKNLNKALMIVTSRPAACKEFRQHARKRIEVLGFFKPQIIEYIHHYFDSDKHKAQQLIAHLEQHPNLMNMAYLPLHCAMLTFLYEEDTVLPETETEFYKHFTLSTLLRYIRKRQGRIVTLTSFDQLPHSDKVIFNKVCKLAFNATVRSKQVFTSNDVKDILTDDVSTKSDTSMSSLGLVVIDHYFMRYGLDETFTFLHLTFQEYLAAVHIAGLSESQRMHSIKTHCEKRHLSVVWRFLCGMMDFTNASAMNTFKSLMETTITNDIKLFQLQCCYESQCSSLYTHVIKTYSGRIEFNSRNFSPSDCVTIGYVINKSDNQTLDLIFNNCNFSSDGALAILQQVGDHPLSLTLRYVMRCMLL